MIDRSPLPKVPPLRGPVFPLARPARWGPIPLP